jgi:hypothetical protein
VHLLVPAAALALSLSHLVCRLLVLLVDSSSVPVAVRVPLDRVSLQSLAALHHVMEVAVM